MEDLERCLWYSLWCDISQHSFGNNKLILVIVSELKCYAVASNLLPSFLSIIEYVYCIVFIENNLVSCKKLH